MSLQLAFSLALHQLATIVWVGGMFFAHFALRPTLRESLEPPQRFRIALGVFGRFFPWVWLSIAAIWVSGGWVFAVLFGARVGPHVHLMMGIALLMTLIFAYIFFGPYRRMKTAVSGGDWPAAALSFGRIRALMAVNLTLGLITALAGSVGELLVAPGG
jgi:uncharacterized membrane protein